MLTYYETVENRTGNHWLYFLFEHPEKVPDLGFSLRPKSLNKKASKSGMGESVELPKHFRDLFCSRKSFPGAFSGVGDATNL
jgi:hypothetical protein